MTQQTLVVAIQLILLKLTLRYHWGLLLGLEIVAESSGNVAISCDFSPFRV